MLSDWESSLTELSSSEDEYVPRAKNSKKPKVKQEYKVSNFLRPYRTTTYTAKSLYDSIIDNTIQLDPEYQRDVVWTESKQVGLIDSLLRNFYIPPVIFAVQRRDDGTETRTCIDGKQRLTSIQLFMDGIIPHRDNLTNKKYWYKESADEKRVLLPRQLLLAIANKQIVCVEYDDLTDDQEREIFQRVQLGVALTVAERMQAIPGPWPALIREVQSIVLGDDGFGEDLDWGHDRGRDFQCLATIIHLIDSHSTIFPGVPRLEKWLSSPTPVPAKTRDAVLDTFRIFITLVKDKRYNAAFSKPARVSPIEFTMIGVLISRFRNTHSLMQLSNAIWRMRADVRSQHEDIRQNSKVIKTMFQFITRGLGVLDLIGDGKGDTPASLAIKARNSAEGSASASRPVPTPSKDKRRRQQDAESSGSEYEEVAPRKRQSLPSSRSAGKAAPDASTASSKQKAAAAKKVATSTSAKTSSSKAVGKTPSKTATATRATRGNATAAVDRPSPASTSQSSTPAPSTSTTRVTGRKTKTALSAAAGSLTVAQAPGPSKLPAKRSKDPPAAPLLLPQAGTSANAPQTADIPRLSQSTPRATPSANDDGSGASNGDPDAMQVDEPANSAQVQTPLPSIPPKLTAITTTLPQQAAGQLSQPPSAVTTPGEQTLQASLEQLLAKHGHNLNVAPTHTPDSVKHASPTPPVSGLSGIHISAQPTAMVTPPAVPPPPPLPFSSIPPIYAFPSGSTARTAASSSLLSEQPSWGSQGASSQGPGPVVIKREHDHHPGLDSDWDMDRSRDRERERSRSRDRSTDRSRSGERYRSRERDRSRSRSYRRSRTRNRSRDRDRGRGHHRSRGRDRSRDRSRSRSWTPSRSRDRDRSRTRDRYDRRNSGKGRDWERDRDGYRGGGRGGDRDRYHNRKSSRGYYKQR